MPFWLYFTEMVGKNIEITGAGGFAKEKVCQTSAIGGPSLIAPASREPPGGEVINWWMNWGLGGSST